MTAMDSHVVDPLGRRRWQAEPGSEKEEDKQKASWLRRGRVSSVCRHNPPESNPSIAVFGDCVVPVNNSVVGFACLPHGVMARNRGKAGLQRVSSRAAPLAFPRWWLS